MKTEQELIEKYQDDIAIIAMAGRFPGANSMDEFWDNLRNSVESITFLNRDDLLNSGVDPNLVDDPSLIGAEGILNDVDKFDAEFFGYSPREAELLDPQHKIFLEVIWELLERSGYSSDILEEVVGVYSGAGASSYLARNLLSHPNFVRDIGAFKVSLSTGQDFVSTRASYKLGLTGPSINVNTLCSSSSVAVHYAREALLSYQCDIALAGGVTISNSREDALFYQEGGIGSYDGHCRAFDAKAAGTVAGNGIALVALKRMEDAIKDGDQILSIIRSSAINNDGGKKASYTAPSPEGQARVITEALEIAGINPETVSYIEAHGTGTNLGDPIEVAGLTRAFSQYTDRKEYCGIGSVKTNIGHLVAAGGVASLIKTVLGIQNKLIPASLNFDDPNPNINFPDTPFYVVDKPTKWEPTGGSVIRAGVSSFGIGGTNAHIIVEEPPTPIASEIDSCDQVIILSAKTPSALSTMEDNLLSHIRQNPEVCFSDLAFTLQNGRKTFEYRSAIVASGNVDLANELKKESSSRICRSVQKTVEHDIFFMFPGQGSQHVNMGRDLYNSEEVFKNHIDKCTEILKSEYGFDILEYLFPDGTQVSESDEARVNIQDSQVSLFIIEYALSQLLFSWGIEPNFMIGHSLGEYTAACLAGVFSLEDAIRVIIKREKIVSEIPSGAMLAVSLSEGEIRKYLSDSIWYSVQNGLSSQIISGAIDDIEKLIPFLEEDGVSYSKLHTSDAFHSGLMDAALAPFEKVLESINFNKPKRKFISNLSGNIAGEEVCSPSYWVNQLRQTVRFGDGIVQLANSNPQSYFIEVGPNQALTSITQHNGISKSKLSPCMMLFKDINKYTSRIKEMISDLWLAGHPINCKLMHTGKFRQRIVLPTYPFERKRYWIEKSNTPIAAEASSSDSNSYDNSLQRIFEIKLTSKNSDVKVSKWNEFVRVKNDFTKSVNSIFGNNCIIESYGVDFFEKRPNKDSKTSSSKEDHILMSGYNRPKSANEYSAPETEIQKVLTSHWEEVLGYSPVGINDNFFDVGGDSLMAASLVARMRKDFGLEIPLKNLLDSPKISIIAEILENMLWIERSSSVEGNTDGEVLEL